MNRIDNLDLAQAIRQLWPAQALPADVRAQTMAFALEALRGSRHRQARRLATRLAVALNLGIASLIGLAILSAARHTILAPAVVQIALTIILVILAFAGCAIAAIGAARWCQETGLMRWPRWLPTIGLCGLAGVALISLTHMRPAPDTDTDPIGARDSIELVSRAFSAPLTADEAQAWLNARLSNDIERAWFVTPDGIIALSSITTANEISRSVLDFVLTPHIRQWMTLTQAATISHPLGMPGGISRITAASVYSRPIALLVMVKEALRLAAGESASRDVVAAPVIDAQGNLTGIAAATWSQPTAAQTETRQTRIAMTGVMAAIFLLSASWATWVYWLARQRRQGERGRTPRPLAWAGFIAVIPPIGVLLYMLNHQDSSD